MNLLEVKGLKTYFTSKKGIFSRTTSHVKAVDGVSFNIGRGEVLALVGESGCGKTFILNKILIRSSSRIFNNCIVTALNV